MLQWLLLHVVDVSAAAAAAAAAVAGWGSLTWLTFFPVPVRVTFCAFPVSVQHSSSHVSIMTLLDQC